MLAQSTQSREFAFSDQHFHRLKQAVRLHTGIHLSDAKRELVYGRLSRRIRSLGLAGFEDYCRLVERRDSDELTEFSNAITTNLTAFFREQHHFDYLRASAIPEMLKRQRDSRRLRIWSAGCSTGEEPYSIAMTVLESIPDRQKWDVRILATDLDSDVLRRASAGVYPLERADSLPKSRLRRWFVKGRGEHAGQVKVSDELKAIVSFRQLNLMSDWPFRHSFDVLFCRNVVIYFDKVTQRKLFARFARVLRPEGMLFIGHSETLFKVSDEFSLLGKTIYRRTGA